MIFVKSEKSIDASEFATLAQYRLAVVLFT